MPPRQIDYTPEDLWQDVLWQDVPEDRIFLQEDDQTNMPIEEPETSSNDNNDDISDEEFEQILQRYFTLPEEEDEYPIFEED